MKGRLVLLSLLFLGLFVAEAKADPPYYTIDAINIWPSSSPAEFMVGANVVVGCQVTVRYQGTPWEPTVELILIQEIKDPNGNTVDVSIDSVFLGDEYTNETLETWHVQEYNTTGRYTIDRELWHAWDGYVGLGWTNNSVFDIKIPEMP